MMSMPLKLLPIVLLEDRLTLDGVLVRARSSVAVAGVGVPRCRRIRVVVRDLAVPNHHVVAEHTANRLGEAATDGLVGHRELLPRLGAPGTDLDQRLLCEVQRARRGVGLEVGPRPVAFDACCSRAAGIFHSSETGPFSAVFGRLICTLCPVAFT